MTGKSDFTLHLYIFDLFMTFDKFQQTLMLDKHFIFIIHMYSLQKRKGLRCLQLILSKTFRKTFNDCTDGISS